MMNFQSQNFEKNRGFLPKKKETIDPRAEEARRGRLLEESFINRPYSKTEVEADLARVNRRRTEYRNVDTVRGREQKRTADLFEKLVLRNFNKALWMGSGAVAIKTSEFDDYFNSVDLVVEFSGEQSPSHLGLAADVTFSSNRAEIAEKFDSLRNKIKRGTLSEVKYFRSEETGYSGPLDHLPEVVIGVSQRTVLELERLQAEKKYKELEEHRAGILILKEIEIQLIVLEKYAQSMRQFNAALIYSDRLAIIRGILAKKAELVAQVEKEGVTDPVYWEIMKTMENWSRY